MTNLNNVNIASVETFLLATKFNFEIEKAIRTSTNIWQLLFSLFEVSEWTACEYEDFTTYKDYQRVKKYCTDGQRHSISTGKALTYCSIP